MTTLEVVEEEGAVMDEAALSEEAIPSSEDEETASKLLEAVD